MCGLVTLRCCYAENGIWSDHRLKATIRMLKSTGTLQLMR